MLAEALPFGRNKLKLILSVCMCRKLCSRSSFLCFFFSMFLTNDMNSIVQVFMEIKWYIGWYLAFVWRKGDIALKACSASYICSDLLNENVWCFREKAHVTLWMSALKIANVIPSDHSKAVYLVSFYIDSSYI